MRARRVKPPVAHFVSPGGRRFEILTGERVIDRWGPETSWVITYEGKPAGVLCRDAKYSAPNEWHATTRRLFWTHAVDAPTGIGFDVAAFVDAREALRAWGRSADEILDWHEGKPVSTPWSGGVKRRQVTS